MIYDGNMCLVDRRWTQDQNMWGLVSSAGYAQKCQANFIFHTASYHLNKIGT